MTDIQRPGSLSYQLGGLFSLAETLAPVALICAALALILYFLRLHRRRQVRARHSTTSVRVILLMLVPTPVIPSLHRTPVAPSLLPPSLVTAVPLFLSPRSLLSPTFGPLFLPTASSQHGGSLSPTPKPRHSAPLIPPPPSQARSPPLSPFCPCPNFCAFRWPASSIQAPAVCPLVPAADCPTVVCPWFHSLTVPQLSVPGSSCCPWFLSLSVPQLSVPGPSRSLSPSCLSLLLVAVFPLAVCPLVPVAASSGWSAAWFRRNPPRRRNPPFRRNPKFRRNPPRTPSGP